MNSEIMTNYAKIMEDRYGIDKYAWTSRDLTKTLALEGVITGAIGGAGAMGVGSGGATGLTGALTALVPIGGGGGAAAGTGLGAAIVSNPIGWIVGAVLLVGGVAAAIYFATKATDDNLRDLIERIEALDYEETSVETRVQSWIDVLNEKLQSMQLPALGAMDDREKAMQLAQKVMEMQSTVDVLKQIAAQWPETKKYLKDWQFFPFDDPADFEEAFEKTYKVSVQALENIKQQSQAAVKQVIESTKNPDLLMTEIKTLDYQITQIWGKPEYTEEEQKALDVGSRIMKRQVDINEYSENLPKLVAIRDDLKRLLPKAQRMSDKKVSEEFYPLSKRAVKLPSKPTAPGVTPSKQRARRPAIQKSETVQNMQRQINDLATALDVPLDARLKEDGIYGPNTARAVADLVGKLTTESDPEIAPEQAKIYEYLKRWGIVGNTLLDVNLMRSTPRYMNVLTNAVDNIYQLHTGTKQRPISTREQYKAGPQSSEIPPETLNDVAQKQNPTDPEILAYFQKLHANVGGGRVNLYDYAQQNLGMRDSDILRLIHSKFPGWAPKTWSVPIILDAMGQKYSILY